jgi:hypothetical protein
LRSFRQGKEIRGHIPRWTTGGIWRKKYVLQNINFNIICVHTSSQFYNLLNIIWHIYIYNF